MMFKALLLVSAIAALAANAHPAPQIGGANPLGGLNLGSLLGGLLPNGTDITAALAASLGELTAIPNLDKYVANYTDFSDLSKFPFIAPMPNGPAPTGCVEHEVLIARGTGELGPFGFIVGDPLMEGIQKSLPDARGYAIQYPANSGADSWQTGVKETVKRLNEQNAACPNQKFAVVGYSQGAMVMHLAFNNWNNYTINDSAFKQVVGGAMFGDPAASPGAKGGSLPLPAGIPNISLNEFPNGLNDKVKLNCATGDPVCTPGTLDIIKHLTYDNPGKTYIPDSAKWIVDHFNTAA